MINRTNTIDEMIEVLQAYKEGKTIEYIIIDNDLDTFTELTPSHLLCNFQTYFYRVKREPAKIYMVGDYSFSTESRAVSYCHLHGIPASSIKEFIEVMPDES